MQKFHVQIMMRFAICLIVTIIAPFAVHGKEVYDATDPDTAAPEISLPHSANGRTLAIPSFNINVDIVTFPLGESTWVISPWEHNAGHFEYTAWIDIPGNVVIGGHSQYPSGLPGIFHDLNVIQPGEVIFVRDGGIERRYIVTEIKTVDYRDLSVLYPTTHNRVTLITCSIPSYVAAQNLYYGRVVVIADEAPLWR